jgi:hypothetical protein
MVLPCYGPSTEIIDENVAKTGAWGNALTRFAPAFLISEGGPFFNISETFRAHQAE